MAQTYLLPLASSSSSCSCSFPPGNAPPSSSSGAVGRASLSQFSAASQLLFSRAGGWGGEGLKGGYESQFAGLRSRQRSARSSVPSNYGRKEYGTLVPPQVKPESKSVEPSSGSGEAPKFWSYGAPKSLRGYTNPKSYGAPKNYGIPAYSTQSGARIAAVEAVEPPKGLVEEAIHGEVSVVEEKPAELAGGGGGESDGGGDEGGGGGGGGDGAGEGQEPEKKMSVAQKLTLAYAALVGVGGVIGYAKSGSNKSLLTGGGAALALFLVYSQLPAHPTFASSFGLGISAVLLGVMYPRFKNSGKFMPAGLVALVSLIMTGGYLHGIVRTAH